MDEILCYARESWKVCFSRRNVCGHMPERQEGLGIIGEGNRAQETGHNTRLIPGTHSPLSGQGRGALEKPPNFFHSAQESNPVSRL